MSAPPDEARPVPRQAVDVAPAPFPARTKQATGLVDGVRTDVTAVSFADKILVTISQEGRLPHWVHVPLQSDDPTLSDRRVRPSEDGQHLLPLPHLTATTLLGGGAEQQDTLAQLYGTQIASAIVAQDPEEKRLLVLGIGVGEPRLTGREKYLQILELVLQCV